MALSFFGKSPTRALKPHTHPHTHTHTPTHKDAMVHLSSEEVVDGCCLPVAPGDTVAVTAVEIKTGVEPELGVGPGLQLATEAELSIMTAEEANDGSKNSSADPTNTVTLKVVISGDLRRRGNTVWVDFLHKRVSGLFCFAARYLFLHLQVEGTACSPFVVQL